MSRCSIATGCWCNEQRHKLRHAGIHASGDYDVLICPVAATAAVHHDHTVPRHERIIKADGRPAKSIDQLFWAGIATLAYLPATGIPIGETQDRLPIGAQVIGPQMPITPRSPSRPCWSGTSGRSRLRRAFLLQQQCSEILRIQSEPTNGCVRFLQYFQISSKSAETPWRPMRDASLCANKNIRSFATRFSVLRRRSSPREVIALSRPTTSRRPPASLKSAMYYYFKNKYDLLYDHFP